MPELRRYESLAPDGTILQFGKLPIVRLIEASARAKEKGARITEVVEGLHYRTQSQSKAGTFYDLLLTDLGWQCDEQCEGYRSTRCCYHLGALYRRADREGWAAGFHVTREPMWAREPMTPEERYADDLRRWYEDRGYDEHEFD